ncbi:MAG: c-type cytochrome [Deltaproteobacteria bacterium]|nr:c-type cytochrome [Deltaproteobacteria bacterium]
MKRMVIIIAVLLATGACRKNQPASGESEGAQTGSAGAPLSAKPDMVEGKKLFEQRCVTCHGAGGKGDGPGAVALNPKPRNYTDKKWQASVSDAQLAQTIVQGGAAVGKSPLMPPNPDLKDKPSIVAGLVAIVRSFGK